MHSVQHLMVIFYNLIKKNILRRDFCVATITSNYHNSHLRLFCLLLPTPIYGYSINPCDMLTAVPANQGWERRRGQIQDSSADNTHGTSQNIAFNESERYNASSKLLLCSVPWPSRFI